MGRGAADLSARGNAYAPTSGSVLIETGAIADTGLPR